MERSTELRLPTVAVPVTLALVGREPAAADLFLAEQARAHGEMLDDIAAMLDEQTPFLPVRTDAGVRLLAKHAIAWISIPIAPDVMTLYDRQHRVAVALVTGATLDGMLLDSAPADRPRVADHLNGAGAFVRLWTSDRHVLVNKAQILHVTELPE